MTETNSNFGRFTAITMWQVDENHRIEIYAPQLPTLAEAQGFGNRPGLTLIGEEPHLFLVDRDEQQRWLVRDEDVRILFLPPARRGKEELTDDDWVEVESRIENLHRSTALSRLFYRPTCVAARAWPPTGGTEC